MNQKLQKLRQKWYQKLKDLGFKDIEDPKTELLKSWSYIELDVDRKDAQEEYYRVASQFLYEKDFPSNEAKLMWQLHSEGQTIRQIAKIMNRSKGSVQWTIEKLRKDFFS